MSRLIAAISVLVLTLSAAAAERPRYGGTLRVAVASAESLAEYTSLAAAGGPFRSSPESSAKQLVLIANDDSRGGRPFVDRIEITMGRDQRDQAIDMELGRADIIDLGADQGNFRREGVRVTESRPNELLGVVYRTELDLRLRQALAAAIDRASIHNVIFQRHGVLAASVLPEWISGYSFVFSGAQDLARARQLRSQAPRAALTLGYEPTDSSMRLVAERIALNARDAGIQVTVVPDIKSADARLARIPVVSVDPTAALNAVAAFVSAAPISDVMPGAVFEAERKMLDEQRLIPLVFLPRRNAVAPRVRNWKAQGGSLADVWLEDVK